MIHPHTQLAWIADGIGSGVLATEAIPLGTILWTRCEFDIVLPPRRLAALPGPYRQIAKIYGYVTTEGDTVLCWDLGRYVNHSCRPTMLPVGPDLEICVRDLEPGDELTCDYGTLNCERQFICRCGRPECRGTVRAEDALTVGEAWSGPIAAALAAASRVGQPLLPYLRDRGAWEAYLSGERPVPGAASYYRDRGGRKG